MSIELIKGFVTFVSEAPSIKKALANAISALEQHIVLVLLFLSSFVQAPRQSQTQKADASKRNIGFSVETFL